MEPNHFAAGRHAILTSEPAMRLREITALTFGNTDNQIGADAEDSAVDADSNDDDAHVDKQIGRGSEDSAVEADSNNDDGVMERRRITSDILDDDRDPSDAENDDGKNKQDHISGASKHQSFNPISKSQISKQQRIPTPKKKGRRKIKREDWQM